MKGSLLQGLGPSRPLPSSAASTSYSTTSSNFQSCRPPRQNSSSHITRQQQRLRTDIIISSQGSLELGSDFYGYPPSLFSKRHWKGKTKDALYHRSYIRQEASHSSRNDLVGFESRGDYRKLLSLEPSKTESSRRGANSKLWNEDQKTAESLVPTSRPSGLEAELDLTMRTKALDLLLSSDMRPPINSRVEHKVSSQSSSQPSPPRIETSYMIAEVPLSGSSRRVHEMSGAYQSSSSSVLVAEQGRSFQNGAASPSNIHRFSSSVRAQKPVFYPRHLRVKQEVKLEVEKFRDPWLSQKWLAQRREVRAPVATEIPYLSSQSSSYGSHMSTQLKQREVQQSVVSSTPKIEFSHGSQGLQQGSLMRQLEASSARPKVGAQRWRDAAKQIEQNRRPALAGGRVEARRENPEGVKVELEPVPDFGNKWNILGDQSRMTQLQKPKEEGAKVELPVVGFEREWSNLDEQSKLLQSLEQLDISTVAEESFPLTSEDVVSETPAKESFILPEYTRSTTGEVLEDTAQLDGEPKWLNPEVLIVDSEATARTVVEKLRGEYKDMVHACDTEVAAIDPKKESPVGHGRMICFSIYCGPQTDFGEGKCRLWVDVLGKDAVLDVFKSYFEDPTIKKVWHNYSFDKHILSNYGINARGFYADTMHLARLYDSARTIVQGGYSLEGLTGDENLMGGYWGELKLDESAGKRSMKRLFGMPNIKKNGEEGKLRVVPAVEDLQTRPEWRDKWIHYSSFDTVCTWCLWRSLQDKLIDKKWMIEGKFKQEGTMYDFYIQYIQPFGEILVQMEANGMLLDRDHLAKIEEVALTQQEFSAKRFRKWAAKRCPDAIHMNVGSDAQIRQLLFGGKENKSNPDKKLEMERVFNAPNTENYIEPGKKIAKKTRPFTLRGLGVDIPVESYTSGGWPAVGGSALKALAGKVAVDYSVSDDEVPLEDLESDPLSEDSPVLTSVGVKHGSEDDLSIYGKAYEAFGGQEEGKEACMAIAALCEVSSINTLISNFIQPLQGNDIKGPDGRVHCSLNINTETGRLSARRPSLQNQPALEKDRYKIRQAFVARPENSLIVADYGQLELRILAHLTDCKSMLKAFVDGGDFHSRTAMNMYPHVRKAVEKGEVILEWEPKPGETKPPVPLLKDVFGAERRKAKMLNFSIAYGKTAMGLSKDWKVSLDEAKSTVELWYSDRQEVRRWQEERINEAIHTNHVHTLLGRTRHFPDANECSKMMRGHIERAAINTPVQGSAADVAMCAMLEIHGNQRLQDLGWKMLLQVHDEVILEGPSASADEAKAIVVKCMSFPFQGKNTLRVALAVDAKYAQSWYAAK